MLSEMIKHDGEIILDSGVQNAAYKQLVKEVGTTIANKPDVVRRFVAATVRGYEYAIAHPDESVEILLRAATFRPPALKVFRRRPIGRLRAHLLARLRFALRPLMLVDVLAVLALFLRARVAFWVTLGIPLSFCGGLLFFPIADISVNMISLFAFIITFLLICNEGGRRPAIMLAAIGIPVYAIILAAAGAMMTEYGEDEPIELIEPELVQDWTLIERDDVGDRPERDEIEIARRYAGGALLPRLLERTP